MENGIRYTKKKNFYMIHGMMADTYSWQVIMREHSLKISN